MSIIKNNRIVSDITFATRLVSFLKNIRTNDMMSDEELDYIKHVANSLLEHQITTVTEKHEEEYLQRCHNTKHL